MLTKIEMATVYKEHGRIERFFSSQDPLARAVRRPWTPIADFFTGVVERKEHPEYDAGVLRGWINGRSHIQFRYYEDPFTSTTYEITDSADQIVAAIGPKIKVKWYPYNYGMQFLRRRDGTVKVTVSDNNGPVDIW